MVFVMVVLMAVPMVGEMAVMLAHLMAAWWVLPRVELRVEK